MLSYPSFFPLYFFYFPLSNLSSRYNFDADATLLYLSDYLFEFPPISFFYFYPGVLNDILFFGSTFLLCTFLDETIRSGFAFLEDSFSLLDLAFSILVSFDLVRVFTAFMILLGILCADLSVFSLIIWMFLSFIYTACLCLGIMLIYYASGTRNEVDWFGLAWFWR